ncbi:hypothetical protein P0Y35_07155 [Kiritimatiellaeota bacterium B1221]|nr:hypothetical protein [Kiritimatiellaeota bacterium B1221]
MTVKKFIALTSVAIAATAMTASAQVAVDFVSSYVFRGAYLGDESIQPGFDTTIFGGTTSVGTWANFDIDSSEFNEVDYFFGYTVPTGEDSPVGIEIGYCEYTYPGAEGDADREPYISFGGAAGGVDIGLGIYYGIGGAIEDSLYLELGLGYGVDLAENLGLGLGAALGYLDPDEGESGFSHLTLNAGLDVAIPESEYVVTVGLTYIVETDDEVQEVEEDFYFTIGTTLL